MTVWRQVKNGAGGYVTGISATPSGSTIVCRTDTSGAYIWNEPMNTWDLLITRTSMPTTRTDVEDVTPGVVALEVAPSDPSTMYMMWMGDIYSTHNRGLLWKPGNVNYAASSDTTANNTNGVHRLLGQRIAIDPANSNVAYFGSYTLGVYRTFDGGTTWELVSTSDIPASTGTSSGVIVGHGGLAFDSTSGTVVVNGVRRTNKIYIPVFGDDVYRSTDGGQTWGTTSCPTTTIRYGRCAANGDYYCVDSSGSSNNIRKWNGSAWSAGTSGNAEGVLPDPNDATKVIGITGGGGLMMSTNSGSTYASAITADRASTGIPWHGFTSENFMSHGGTVMINDTIWFSMGIGVFTTSYNSGTLPNPTIWTTKSYGIENFAINHVLCPPSPNPNRVHTIQWDRSVFNFTNPEAYPSKHSPHITFTSADVNTTTNRITVPGHNMTTDNRSLNITPAVGSTLPSPLTTQTGYFANIVDADTIELSATAGGASIDLTTTGSGTFYGSQGGSITMAWHMDYAKDDPTFLAYPSFWAVNANSVSRLGWKSTDSGETWRPFSGTLPGCLGQKNGGCIAVATSDNMVIVPSNSYVPFYTTDGGATWTQSNFPSGVASPYRAFVPTDVDATADTIAISNHGFSGNEQVYIRARNGFTPPGGLTLGGGVSHFIKVVDPNTIQLSLTSGGSAINLTNTGTAGGEFWIFYGTGPYDRTFVPGDVDTGTDQITIPNHGFRDNAVISIGSSGTLPAGFPTTTGGNARFVRFVDNDTIQVSTTSGGAAANLTDQGSGTHRLIPAPDTGFGFAYYNNAITMVADPNNIGYFYAFNILTQRVYRSTDGGATFIERGPASGTIDSLATFAPKMFMIPGQNDHIFLVGGNVGGVNPGNSKLSRSTDGGVTWSDANTAMRDVVYACWGKAASGASYPTIYCIAYKSGVKAIYRSIDNCTTFNSIGSPSGPDDFVGSASCIAASPINYGEVYIGCARGYYYRTEAMQVGRLR